MAKKRNKIKEPNDDKNMIPPGEDQYLLGWGDAERLENIKPGLARSFIKLSSIATGFHLEYVKGFSTYVEKHAPILEAQETDKDKFAREFLELLQKELNKR